MIKAIFCDLDGTLLKKDMSFSEENSKAIFELVEAGIRFIPTTGRNFFEMPREIIRHGAISQFLCSNGSAFYDIKSGESRHKSIPCDKAVAMLDMLSKMSVVPVIHSLDGRGYFEKAKLDIAVMRDHRMNEYYCNYFTRNAYAIEGIYSHFADGIGINSVCAFFKHEEELIEARDEILRLGIGCTNSLSGELETFNKDAGKGNALRDFAAVYGLLPDETMAIGDSENDVSMLKATPNSVAVRGANEKLLTVAKHVGCSNDEHILRYVIDNLL